MIDSIHIQNFQSHRDTVLNLHKGVNVIVGKSDCGKSAILRALRWIVFNRPRGGKSFRSHWGGDTIVSLTEGSETNNRIKTNTEDKYTTDIGECVEQHSYTALAGKVPEDIQDLLAMSNINFQHQMDAPFLLADSSGEVARKLNNIVNLNVIDESLKRINSSKLDTTKRLRQEEEHTEDLKARLKYYEDIPKREALISKIERKNKEKKLFENQQVLLFRHTQELSIIETKLENTLDLSGAEESIKQIEKQQSMHKTLCDESSDLRNLLGKLQEVEKKLNSFSSLSKAKTEIETIGKQQQQLSQLKEDRNALEQLVNGINYRTRQIEELLEEHCRYKKRWKILMPDECPLCGQEIVQ